MHQMGTVSISLNGTLEAAVYMQQLEIFDDGSKKSNRNSGDVFLNESITNELFKIGHVRGEVDRCVHQKVDYDQKLYVDVHFDDALIFSNNFKSNESLKTKLANKFKKT